MCHGRYTFLRPVELPLLRPAQFQQEGKALKLFCGVIALACYSRLGLIHLCSLYADTGKQCDYSSRLRSQQIAIGGCLPAVHSHSRTNSARLVVYATKKSAEMPRQTYQQRRDRFRKASTCLRRSCASFVFVYRRRALLIPAYMTGGLVSRWNEEQPTGIKALARRSIQVNCSVQ